MSDAAPAGFSCSTEADATPAGRPAAILACEGDFDLAAIAGFEQAVEESDGGALVVDLSGVRFIDSSGIHALVKTRTRGTAVEIVVAPDSAVDRVLDLSGLRDDLAPTTAREAALAALDAGPATEERPTS